MQEGPYRSSRFVAPCSSLAVVLLPAFYAVPLSPNLVLTIVDKHIAATRAISKHELRPRFHDLASSRLNVPKAAHLRNSVLVTLEHRENALR